ncbi:hypothetical protein GCM10009544_03680 [Streptomyces stramineus]|uniref:Uncharacterized protein n=1 Tax=Streptomyces stramineus TaxID=173861 RepID=A0ABN0ZDD3_9ACTN
MQLHVLTLRHVGQMLDLAAHHLRVAVGAMQHGLVQDDMDLRGVLGDEELLPLKTYGHGPFDVDLACDAHAVPHHGAGICLCLQQVVHEIHLV